MENIYIEYNPFASHEPNLGRGHEMRSKLADAINFAECQQAQLDKTEAQLAERIVQVDELKHDVYILRKQLGDAQFGLVELTIQIAAITEEGAYVSPIKSPKKKCPHVVTFSPQVDLLEEVADLKRKLAAQYAKTLNVEDENLKYLQKLNGKDHEIYQLKGAIRLLELAKKE